MKDLINEEIRIKYSTIIDENGNNLGSLPVRKALDMAAAAKKDLVLVRAPSNGVGAVCKIMDYHKVQFQKKKAMKRPDEIETKEIQFNVEIADHDLGVHVNKYNKWASKGKVRCMIRVKMHGRYLGRPEMALDTFQRFVALLPGGSVIDKQPVLNGRDYIAYIKNF